MKDVMEMELSKDEIIVLNKFRRAKRYTRENRQAEIEIRILPGGRVSLIRAVFQEKINTDEVIFKE
jgi:hypothetical protein